MIASEIAKDALLPFVISRIGAQTIESAITSRNPHRTGEFSRNATASLNPRDSREYTTDDPRRQSNIDQVLAQREKNMKIREATAQIAQNPLDQSTIAEQYGQYGNSPFMSQPVIQPLNTLPSIPEIIPEAVPMINNEQSSFDVEDEDLDLDTDLMHQRLIDNINNGLDVGDELPLDDGDNNSENDPVNIQQRRNAEERKDRPPEYPGGNGNNPSVGDIIRKGDEIVKVIQNVIPKRKPEEKKQKPEKKAKPEKINSTEETADDKKKKNTGAKVDIHDVFSKSIVNKTNVNTKRLL